MIVELLRGRVAAHGSPRSAAEGVGLLEDEFNAHGPAGGFCAGTAGYCLLAQSEVTTNQMEAGETLAFDSVFGLGERMSQKESEVKGVSLPRASRAW